MDLIDPMWGPLLGLLVLAAVVVAAVRVRRDPGNAPMRRAMATVGGGIVVFVLIGLAAEGCAGPTGPSADAPAPAIGGH